MNYYDRDGQPMTFGEWTQGFGDNVLARTEVDDVAVSTVWLGLDHNFSGIGPPLIFETMIFGGEHDEDQWRYATKEQALTGHAEACKLAFSDQGDDSAV